jgi:hypothetical protein
MRHLTVLKSVKVSYPNYALFLYITCISPQSRETVPLQKWIPKSNVQFYHGDRKRIIILCKTSEQGILHKILERKMKCRLPKTSLKKQFRGEPSISLFLWRIRWHVPFYLWYLIILCSRAQKKELSIGKEQRFRQLFWTLKAVSRCLEELQGVHAKGKQEVTA